MYLKSLELHGFKSFPNKTVLTFERGTTIVVGPNGSGKSNISDAMRWVLGELSSRNIRGTKMEDVIFGGTDLRRPMSFAEVSVTFDNSDDTHRIDSPYDEITVTRRYYRSGESEYMINRKNCRLRDIHELFMNTGVGREGYSIIGQGKIADILSKKSEDRRSIFEEAAGISKFRQRKEESEKKLTATMQNMESLMLIFNELDARIGPLAKDAEKARRYRDLLESKKCADVSLWLFDTQKIKIDLQNAENAFRLAGAEYERLKESIESLEAQSDHIHDKLTGSRIASEELMSRITEITKKISGLENAYQLAVGNVRHLMELMERSKVRLEELDAEDEKIRERQKENRARITALQSEEEEVRDAQLTLLLAMDELAKEAERLGGLLADKLAEIESLNQKAMVIRVRLDVSRKAKTDGAGKSEELAREIEKYRAAESDLEENVAHCERATSTYREKIDQAEAAMAAATDTLAEVERELLEKNRLLTEAHARHSGFAQRIEALRRMEEHFEGYQQSVRFVMQEYGRNPSVFRGKVHGPVSKLIGIQPKYITAIEAALGQNLQNVVVENDATATAAIMLLKNNGAGRATFYPISAIRSPGSFDELNRAKGMTGYIGCGAELIDYDPAYRNVMEYLLLRTLVFDTIEHATEAAKALRYRVRLVTLDGQLINAGGSYTGGSVRRDSGLLSRGAEIEQLEREAKNARDTADSLTAEIKNLDDSAENARQKIKNAEQTRELLYTMSRAQFSELDSAKAKLEANRALLATLVSDFERLQDNRGHYDADIAELETELAALMTSIEERRAWRAEQDIVRQGILDERDAKGEQVNASKLRSAMIGKDIEACLASIETDDGTLATHITDREAVLLQIREYEDRVRGLEDEKTRNLEETDTLRAALRGLQDERSDTEQNSEELDRIEKELREKIRSANDDRERCFAEYTRTESRLTKLREDNERLENKLWDEYQITYEQAVALNYPPVTASNRSEVASVQASCKARIRELGNVNPNAVEEYEDVRTRHEEMKKQLDDLTASCDELREIVARVEDEMRVSFSRTFEQINENFGVVFAELFGGGQAELSLTDPSDVLTSGIEIKAAPPGKIIKSLSLLSGGEQTIVAIALIFAILKANPTPFCIFDEIEAALDEVNVDRFGAYVQKYSSQTQFVLITHRRGTMEIGNRLYGITMPERGVSRAVPLDVSEIESRQKELLA